MEAADSAEYVPQLEQVHLGINLCSTLRCTSNFKREEFRCAQLGQVVVAGGKLRVISFELAAGGPRCESCETGRMAGTEGSDLTQRP